MTTDPGIELERRRQLAALEDSRRREQALAAELRVAQDELERARQLRDEFMAMVVHELRTPLSVLAMEVRVRQHRLAAGNAGFFAPDNLARMFERDQRQVRSLTRLVDDLLDVSRMRHGRLLLRRGPCELVALLRRVVAEVQDQHDDVPVTLATDGSEVHGDWDEFRLEQVVVTLLANALRYGAGKPVRVELTRLADAVAIDVVDQGIGIAREDLPRVFEPFAGLGDRRRAPGLGLGLSIARQLVQAHGGTLGVASTLGEGSIFTVALPTTASEAPGIAEA